MAANADIRQKLFLAAARRAAGRTMLVITVGRAHVATRHLLVRTFAATGGAARSALFVVAIGLAHVAAGHFAGLVLLRAGDAANQNGAANDCHCPADQTSRGSLHGMKLLGNAFPGDARRRTVRRR